MAWILLVVAGLFEVAWAVAMKYSDGLENRRWAVVTIAASIVSFLLLARAMKTLDAGPSYAVWTGIGAVGVTAFGILLFGESSSMARIVCIGLIVVGIIGLKFTG